MNWLCKSVKMAAFEAGVQWERAQMPKRRDSGSASPSRCSWISGRSCHVLRLLLQRRGVKPRAGAWEAPMLPNTSAVYTLLLRNLRAELVLSRGLAQGLLPPRSRASTLPVDPFNTPAQPQLKARSTSPVLDLATTIRRGREWHLCVYPNHLIGSGSSPTTSSDRTPFRRLLKERRHVKEWNSASESPFCSIVRGNTLRIPRFSYRLKRGFLSCAEL